MSTPEHVDAVVVGSGFGGSVTAYRSRTPENDGVLERGKAWAPGTFPRQPSEVGRNFWDPSKGLFGFFDIWSFSGNRGARLELPRRRVGHLRERPAPEGPGVVRQRGGEDWPITREDLDPHYDNVEAMMNRSGIRSRSSRTPRREDAGDAGEPGRSSASNGCSHPRGRVREPRRSSPSRVSASSTTPTSTASSASPAGSSASATSAATSARRKRSTSTTCRASRRRAATSALSARSRSFAPRAGGGFEVKYVRHSPNAARWTRARCRSRRSPATVS